MTIDRYQEAKRVTILGAVINAFLGVIKLVGGYAFHSHALIADGVHSFSDLITDVMVVFASRYGSIAADDTHHYGHQRIETAATLALALLLILAGMGIAIDSLHEILYETSTKPGLFTLPIAMISIIANEALFHYTKYIGNRVQSDLLIANAWHHRSDAAASLIVVLGLAGSIFGFHRLDALAAVIVGFMIVKMGISYGWHSIRELIDTAVEPKTLEHIRQIILSVPGVDKIHQLRTRSMGGNILVDVHILVSPLISVSEGHYIAQHVHRNLLTKLKLVKDVTVHVDPEDDEIVCPSLHCASRDYLEQHYMMKLRDQYPQIQWFTLHYQDGTIILDIILDESFIQSDDFKNSLNQMVSQQPDIKDIRTFTIKKLAN